MKLKQGVLILISSNSSNFDFYFAVIQKLSIYFSIAVSCCFAPLASGQLPELQVQKLTIENEIQEAERLLSVESGSGSFLQLSLARNYYQIDDYQHAEEYYLKVIDLDICSPLDFKAFAISLLHNQKIDLANDIFQTYLQNSPNEILESLWKEAQEDLDFNITKTEKNITDYNYVYGGINPDGSVFLNIDHGTVSAEIGCNTLRNLEAIEFPVDKMENIGSWTKNDRYEIYYFSYKKESGYYAIYSVELSKKGWKKPKELDLGQKDANYVFPYFINSTLFFSSDKAGGYGKQDIYKAQMDADEVENTSNLGASVNTDKNEILPSVVNGSFMFSSNGLPGKGGYDIYFSDWNFVRVSSLDKPFNTELNEYQLFEKTAYTASVIKDRGQTINMQFIQWERDFSSNLEGIVTDAYGKTLSGTKVLLYNKNNSQNAWAYTDSIGRFKITVPDTVVHWNIHAIKDGYNQEFVTLNTRTLGENALVVSLTKIKPVEPEQIYIIQSPSNHVLPVVPTDSLIFDSATVANGDATIFEVNDAGKYYIIFGSTKSYVRAYELWVSWHEKDSTFEILEHPQLGLYRIGLFAGTTRKAAVAAYQKAKRLHKEVWILKQEEE